MFINSKYCFDDNIPKILSHESFVLFEKIESIIF